jgi:hypothetical protein
VANEKFANLHIGWPTSGKTLKPWMLRLFENGS